MGKKSRAGSTNFEPVTELGLVRVDTIFTHQHFVSMVLPKELGVQFVGHCQPDQIVPPSDSPLSRYRYRVGLHEQVADTALVIPAYIEYLAKKNCVFPGIQIASRALLRLHEVIPEHYQGYWILLLDRWTRLYRSETKCVRIPALRIKDDKLECTLTNNVPGMKFERNQLFFSFSLCATIGGP